LRGLLCTMEKGDLVMDKEQLLKMDTHILLSILNMKLRDEFDSLDTLCEDYDIEELKIKDKIRLIGYEYHKNTNQFIAGDGE
jgi:hypothetical protein